MAISLDEAEDLAIEQGLRNKWDLAAQLATRMLPQIFRVDSPVFEIQLPPENQQQLEKLISGLPVDVFAASDSLGWVYQFWQANRKEMINKSEVKIGARELPAVTQLFTEDYMVDFLLDNTLGAWWAGKCFRAEVSTKNTEGTKGKKGETAGPRKREFDVDNSGERSGVSPPVHSRTTVTPESSELNDSALSNEERQRCESELRTKTSLPGMSLSYLRFIPISNPDSSRSCFSCFSWTQPHWTPAAGTFDGWPKTAKELKCLDPCMGSGHFIVAMFERLVALRVAEEQLDKAESIAAVIRDNVFGLEIDPRCTQIAAFNLAVAAWRRVGYCVLPAMNLACSGVGPECTVDEWLTLAEQSEQPMTVLSREPIENGLRNLHELFSETPTLGSLIDPNQLSATMFAADYETLLPFLSAAMAAESSNVPRRSASRIHDAERRGTLDETVHERAVAAAGMVKATELLAGEYTLVITNVPYLGRGKQDHTLRKHLEQHFPHSKADLATAFVERCVEFCAKNGTTALVTPQNWLFLTTYTTLRESLLKQQTWNLVARLGAGAFETISGEVVNAVLLSLSAMKLSERSIMSGIDVSAAKEPSEKAASLRVETRTNISVVEQRIQLQNADATIVMEAIRGSRLNECATSYRGHCNGDGSRFERGHWELILTRDWELLQSAPTRDAVYSGCSHVLLWEHGAGSLFQLANDLRAVLKNVHLRGRPAWKQRGIVVMQMDDLPMALYAGQIFDGSCATIIPSREEHLPALWAFASCGQFAGAVRKLNQKVNVENGFFTKVPFDLAHWQQVALEKYPDGLPEPESDDPTPWLFHGRPEASTCPLQVAVARLLGYRWPAELEANVAEPRPSGSGSETDVPSQPLPDGRGSECMRLSARARELVLRCDELLPFADTDGIVCIPPVRGESGAADRLLNLLAESLKCSVFSKDRRTIHLNPKT